MSFQAKISPPHHAGRKLKLKRLAALCYTTDEVLEDSPEVLGPIVEKVFAEDVAFKVTDAILNGEGTGTPLGVVNAGGTITVEKEVGQQAASVVAENVLKMWSRLWGIRDRMPFC